MKKKKQSMEQKISNIIKHLNDKELDFLYLLRSQFFKQAI